MSRYQISLTMPDEAKARLRTALKLMGATELRISEAAAAEQANPKRSDTLPTSPEALAVAVLFRRRPDQEWSDLEIKAFRAARNQKLLSINDMTLITKYYQSERKKGRGEHGGIDRRDMLTFLRHAGGETDRAKAYADLPRSGAAARPYKIIPMPVVRDERPMTAEEAAAHERFLQQMADRKKQTI